MSGRGVITSRTRLSLNSTTCSIKIGLLRLDDAFFLGLLDQRFDSLFGALLFALIRLLLGDSGQRLRAFQKNAHRPDQPHGGANQRQQRQQPASGGAVQQHVRNEVHQDDDFQRQKDAELDERFPRAGNEVDDAASGLQHQKRRARNVRGCGTCGRRCGD